MRKNWSDDDTFALEEAARTGRLADGRVASQERIALALECSRRTVAKRCLMLGLRLPLSGELMRQGGKVSALRRRMARPQTTAQAKGRS